MQPSLCFVYITTVVFSADVRSTYRNSFLCDRFRAAAWLIFRTVFRAAAWLIFRTVFRAAVLRVYCNIPFFGLFYGIAALNHHNNIGCGADAPAVADGNDKKMI